MNKICLNQDFYQQLMQFMEDILMTKVSRITHHGQRVDEDEEFTPTLENVIAYIWLNQIHSGLPKLVKQKYAADLKNQSLASLRLQISSAIPSLLEELLSLEDT